MPNAYHNLSGWLRDVYAVLGDETELARVRRSELYELVAELIPAELWGGDDESPADELESEDADDDVADAGSPDGGDDGKSGPRTPEGRPLAVGGVARMGNLLPRTGGQQVTVGTGSDTAGVAGTYERVMRRGWIAEGVVVKPRPLNPPKPIRASSGSSPKKRRSSGKAKRRATKK